jgi:hypothetical protein
MNTGVYVQGPGQTLVRVNRGGQPVNMGMAYPGMVGLTSQQVLYGPGGMPVAVNPAMLQQLQQQQQWAYGGAQQQKVMVEEEDDEEEEEEEGGNAGAAGGSSGGQAAAQQRQAAKDSAAQHDKQHMAGLPGVATAGSSAAHLQQQQQGVGSPLTKVRRWTPLQSACASRLHRPAAACLALLFWFPTAPSANRLAWSQVVCLPALLTYTTAAW